MVYQQKYAWKYQTENCSGYKIFCGETASKMWSSKKHGRYDVFETSNSKTKKTFIKAVFIMDGQNMV